MKYKPEKGNPPPKFGKSTAAKLREERREKWSDRASTFGVYIGLIAGIIGPKILQNYTYGATTWGDLQIPNWIDVVVAFITSAGVVARFEYTPGSPEAKALAKLGKKKNFWRRLVFAASVGSGLQGLAGPVI